MFFAAHLIFGSVQFDNNPIKAEEPNFSKTDPRWKRGNWPDHWNGLQLEVKMSKKVGSTIYLDIGVRNISERLIQVNDYIFSRDIMPVQINDGRNVVHYRGDNFGYSELFGESYLWPGEARTIKRKIELWRSSKNLFVCIFTAWVRDDPEVWTGRLFIQNWKIWPPQKVEAVISELKNQSFLF